MANIKENLLKMKDISETMLDLAYTAIFLHDKTIALRVKEMCQELKELEKKTIKILFKVRDSDEEKMGIIDLADYIKDVGETAVLISQLSTTEEFEDLAKGILGETDERTFTATVGVKSFIAGKPLALSKVRTRTRARILCLKRNKNWIFKIDKETILQPGDLLVAVGSQEAEVLFKKIASGRAEHL